MHINQKMQGILCNLSLVDNICKELVRPRNINYLQSALELIINPQVYSIQHLPNIRTFSGCQMKCTLIKHKLQFSNSHIANKKCIVYLHGLNSNRFQSLYLTRYLPPEYCLCIFDFQGFGKSIGHSITYGVRESEDIKCILQYLKSHKKINEFILWGRSMGAVAALLYTINLAQSARQSLSSKQVHKSIKGMVLDSPFSDFRQITKYIVKKELNVPQFILEFILNSVEKRLDSYLQSNRGYGKTYNPFKIKLKENIIQTYIPTIFLYSLSDDIVPKWHSQTIIQLYRAPFQKIIMDQCLHNDNRPKSVIDQVFGHLRQFSSAPSNNLNSHYGYGGLNNEQAIGEQSMYNLIKRKGIRLESNCKQARKQRMTSFIEKTDNKQNMDNSQYTGTFLNIKCFPGSNLFPNELHRHSQNIYHNYDYRQAYDRKLMRDVKFDDQMTKKQLQNNLKSFQRFQRHTSSKYSNQKAENRRNISKISMRNSSNTNSTVKLSQFNLFKTNYYQNQTWGNRFNSEAEVQRVKGHRHSQIQGEQRKIKIPPKIIQSKKYSMSQKQDNAYGQHFQSAQIQKNRISRHAESYEYAPKNNCVPFRTLGCFFAPSVTLNC